MIPSFLKILGATDAEIDLCCQTRLEARGFIVEIRGPWETEKQLCLRLEISDSKFRRRWKRYGRPKESDIQLSTKGRIVLIRSNPSLDRFLAARAWAPSTAPIAELDLSKKIIIAGVAIKAKKGVIIRVAKAKRRRKAA